MTTRSRTRRGQSSQAIAVACATCILLTFGLAHRRLNAMIGRAVGEVTPLTRPLASLPMHFGRWRGSDRPLDPNVLRTANFDDEYLNREYERAPDGVRVSVFVGYVGRPRSKLGHRPDICFATHGWNKTFEEPLRLRLASGRSVMGVLYAFRSPGLDSSRALVLSTYVVNGRFTASVDDLNSYNSRNPGLFGERPAYVTRLQIGITPTRDRSADVAALVDLASQAADSLTGILPYMVSDSVDSARMEQAP